MAPPNLKSMIQIKVKPRQDSYSDQYSRIVMVKLLMMTAAVTGLTWMKDKLNCVVPKEHDLSADFVSKSCWINGLYIYRDLLPKEESYFYGIPNSIELDGRIENSLCATVRGRRKIEACKPLEKTFFLQYQWFPLGVAALSFLYYLPYLLFRVVNADMQEVKEAVKDKKADEFEYEEFLKKHFNNKSKTSVSRLQARILLNILVKVLYVVSNVGGMLILDMALNGRFMGYAGEWSSWLERPNTGRHDYTAVGETKAGHELLPGFGICQVESSGQDVKNTVSDVHTYVCELSQHVLYQYILIVMWYALIAGIIISILGLLKHIYDLIAVSVHIADVETKGVKNVFSRLTAREKEYMKFIRRKNAPVFAELVRRLDQHLSNGNHVPSDRSSYGPGNFNEKESMMMS